MYYKESHRKVYHHLGEQISKKVLRFPTRLETKGYEFFNGYLLITFLYSFQGHPQASARAGSQGGFLFSGLDVSQDYCKMHTEKKQQIYKIERGVSSRSFMSDPGLGYLTRVPYLDYSSYNVEAGIRGRQEHGLWSQTGPDDLLTFSSFMDLTTSLNLSVLHFVFCRSGITVPTS